VPKSINQTLITVTLQRSRVVASHNILAKADFSMNITAHSNRYDWLYSAVIAYKDSPLASTMHALDVDCIHVDSVAHCCTRAVY